MFLVAAAAVTGGAVVALGASSGAQTDDPPIELVSVGLPAPYDATDHRRPALSDTGAVLAFATIAAELDPGTASGDATGGETVDAESVDRASGEPITVDARVWIRDRSADTTRPVAELGSGAPAISGDGCLVAYVVTDDSPDPEATLTTVDRCTADRSAPLPIGRVVDTVPAAGDVTAAPAVSADGSTIVWSTGDEVRRYVRSATTLVHELADAFDADVTPTAQVRTGGRVDVSADGRTVVFVAGPGERPFAPDAGNVYVWSRPDEEPAAIELLSATSEGHPGAAPSGSPTIAADGTLVAFESVSTDLALLEAPATDPNGAPATDTLEAPATDPFIVLVDRSAASASVVADDGRSPSLSADGTRLVHRRGEALQVLTVGDDGTVTEERLLAGVVAEGPATTSQHGRWVAWAGTAPLAGEGTAPLAGEGSGVWAADLRPTDGDLTDTTTTTTVAPAATTTAPGPTTTVGSNGPGAVPAPTIVSRPVVAPRAPSPFPTYRRATSSSSASSTGSGGSFLDSSATPIRFDPTTVGAGRRTAATTFTAGRSTTVTSVEVTSGPFAVAGDTCSGLSLSTGGTCSVEVDFRPDTVGPVSGLLTFRLDDGSVTSAQLAGEGSPEPTLELVPAVATPGQVVTVFGAGFPAGAVVELQHGIEGDDVAVGAAGTFAHTFVVMSRTPAGPMELVVLGQLDRFADVTGELLVSSRSLGTGSPAFRDGIVTGLGR